MLSLMGESTIHHQTSTAPRPSVLDVASVLDVVSFWHSSGSSQEAEQQMLCDDKIRASSQHVYSSGHSILLLSCTHSPCYPLSSRYNLTLPDCTAANFTSCTITSNASTGAVLPPVRSARLTTQLSRNIQFGRVEIRARMPRGDWLWPALWMMPVNETYGPWPASGEIDIIEARGNSPEDYSFQYALGSYLPFVCFHANKTSDPATTSPLPSTGDPSLL